MALVVLGVGLSPYLNVLKTQYHSEKYFAIKLSAIKWDMHVHDI